MALKQGTYVREGALAQNNAERILARPASKEAKDTASYLAIVLAELVDGIASGQVTHVTLGQPKDRSCILLTVNYANGSASRVGALDLFDLADEALAKLTDHATGGQMA